MVRNNQMFLSKFNFLHESGKINQEKAKIEFGIIPWIVTKNAGVSRAHALAQGILRFGHNKSENKSTQNPNYSQDQKSRLSRL